MKLSTFYFFLAVLTFSACTSEDEESDPTPETTTTEVFGNYKFNGVDKDIVKADFNLSEFGSLLISFVDEDGRELVIILPSFEGEGQYQYPSQDTQVRAFQYYAGSFREQSFSLTHTDSSQVAVIDLSPTQLSGSFHLNLSTPETNVQANWMEGQFYNVPSFESVQAEVGSRIMSANRIVTIDSIYTRWTNTYFLETYVYANSKYGRNYDQIFRWSMTPEGTIDPPHTFFGKLVEPYTLFEDVDTQVSFDGSSLTTTTIRGGGHFVNMFFQDLPIDEYPRDYGQPGEILVYSENEITAFDEVEVDLTWGVDTVLVATNQMGNKIVARSPLLGANTTGLDTNAEKPGVAVDLQFYSDESAEEPIWDYLGFMHYEYNEDGSINLGFETPFRLNYYDDPPTYLRGKSLSL